MSLVGELLPFPEQAFKDTLAKLLDILATSITITSISRRRTTLQVDFKISTDANHAFELSTSVSSLPEHGFDTEFAKTAHLPSVPTVLITSNTVSDDVIDDDKSSPTTIDGTTDNGSSGSMLFVMLGIGSVAVISLLTLAAFMTYRYLRRRAEDEDGAPTVAHLELDEDPEDGSFNSRRLEGLEEPKYDAVENPPAYDDGNVYDQDGHRVNLTNEQDTREVAAGDDGMGLLDKSGGDDGLQNSSL